MCVLWSSKVRFCLPIFITGERNDSSKQLIKSKVTEYMDRAEALKKHIASEDKGRSAVGVNGSGAATGPAGKQ